jgi:hypothetical protein
MENPDPKVFLEKIDRIVNRKYFIRPDLGTLETAIDEIKLIIREWTVTLPPTERKTQQ